MNNPFAEGWRSTCNIADLTGDGTRVMVQVSHAGCLYTLQRDWKWSTCPLGMTFENAHQAYGALANVSHPSEQESAQ